MEWWQRNITREEQSIVGDLFELDYPMSDSQDVEKQSLLARLVIWVVPSVTALMIIVGFVASTAHFSLLGFDPGYIGTTEYAAVSGELVRDLASVGFALPTGLGSLIFDWPRSLFLVAGTLVWVALVTTRFSSIVCGPRGQYSAGPIILLGIILVAKFYLLDGPLMRIDNVVVAFNKPSQVEFIPSDSGLSLENRLEAQKAVGLVAGYLPTRAQDIWENMKCSRVSTVNCVNSKADSGSAVRGEFLAHLFSAILLAITITHLIKKTRSAYVLTWALIGSLSCLSLPYAYGKLERSTHYLYGIITLKKSGDASDRVSAKPAAFEVTGFVLLQGASFASVLTRVDLGACPSNGQNVSPRRMYQAKLWQLPNSEIVSVKEIRRNDLIEWKTLVEQSCLDAGKSN